MLNVEVVVGETRPYSFGYIKKNQFVTADTAVDIDDSSKTKTHSVLFRMN